MWVFAKKLELNTLRFDGDIRVLSLKFKLGKKNQNFPFFPPPNKKNSKSANFHDFFRFFFLHGQLVPHYSICRPTLILGGMK